MKVSAKKKSDWKSGTRPRSSSASPSGNSLATDLDIPVQELLGAEEEVRLGNTIQSAFRRIERHLPNTVEGYEQTLALLVEVHERKRIITAWYPHRDRMARDIRKISDSLEQARLALTKGRGRPDTPRKLRESRKHFEKGVRLLKRYPLKPEFLFRFASKVAEREHEGVDLHLLPCSLKAERIVKRCQERVDESRNRLVLPNLRLVLKEVFRFQPTGMRRSDLFQEGILGLHRGIFRYDPSRKTRFSTYATYWIRQSIRKCLIDRSRLIRVPQAVQEDLRNADSKRDPEERQRVQRILRGGTSMFGENDDSPRDRFDWEFIRADQDSSAFHENLHVQKVPAQVHAALDSLDHREREILTRRFGIDGHAVQTLEQIGNALKLSRERIRQIERKALEKMQGKNDLLAVYEELS